MFDNFDSMDDSLVRGEEHYLRWIFQPRHISNGEIRDNFISLRPDETGISGQIYERIEEIKIYEVSSEYAIKNKNYGYAIAKVGDIRDLAKANDYIDVVMTESLIPAHAEIQFQIEGHPIIGNTPNSKMTYYFLKIKELLSKTIHTYST